MHCLLCKHGANELVECTQIDGVIACEDCAHDECLFANCENCGNAIRTDKMIEADNGEIYCTSCVPYRWSENDAPTFCDDGWDKYSSALKAEALATTATDLGNALSKALKVA